MSLDILFQKERKCSKANGVVSQGFKNQIKGLALVKVRRTRASEIIMSLSNGNTLNNSDRKKQREREKKGEEIFKIRNVIIMVFTNIIILQTPM